MVVGIISVSALASAQPAKEREKKGLAFVQQQKWDEAIVEFQAALAADPKRITVFLQLGFAYESKGELQLAVDTYRRYPDTGDLISEARDSIKRVESKLDLRVRERVAELVAQARTDAGNNGYDKAIAAYEEAYRLRPEPAHVWAIAKLYEAKGAKRGAVEQYRRYTTVAPQGEHAQDARTTITRLESDLQSEQIVALKRSEAESAANESKSASAEARDAVLAINEALANRDATSATAKLEVGRASAAKASAAASIAARAARTASDASKVANTPDAMRMAAEAEAFAATAKQDADAATAGIESSAKLVGVPKEKDAPLTPPVMPPPVESEAPGHGLRVTGVAFGVAGGAALVTGIVFGLLARSAANDVSSVADDKWTTDLDQRVLDGERNETISLICYGSAALLAAGGAVIYYLGNRETSRVVTPTVSTTSVGLNLGWTF